MIRIVLIVLFVLLISACTEPRERMLPANVSQLETDQEFQSALAELTLEERNLLTTYLIRVEMEQLAGGAPLANITIGAAINDQILWVEQWRKQSKVQQAKDRAAKLYKDNYLSRVEVVGLKVLEQRTNADAGMQRSFCGSIINKGNKSLCDVQLTIYFLDKYGQEISEVSYRPVQVQADLENADHIVLLPNEKIDFNYPIIGDIPVNWTGMASSMVTNVEFSEASESIKN